MITLRINAAGKLVDEGGGILPAAVRPELAAGIKYYDIELIPVSGVAAGTYTLSGDIEFRRVNTMFLATATVETGEPLRFRVSTDTAGFWGKMRCRQPGTVLYIRCTAATADGDAVSVLEDRIYARPGVAGSDDAPAPNPGAITTLNGLNGAVTLVDADGKPLETDGQKIIVKSSAGGSGKTIIANPAAERPVWDARWRSCRYLDATTDSIDFIAPVSGVTKIGVWVTNVTDYMDIAQIVLIPEFTVLETGELVAGDPVVVTANSNYPEKTEFAVAGPVAPCALRLRRDYNNASDDLQDGGVITAVVLAVELEVNRA